MEKCYYCERKIEFKTEHNEWTEPKTEVFIHSFKDDIGTVQRFFCSLHCVIKQYPEKNTPFTIITKKYLEKNPDMKDCEKEILQEG